MWSGYLGKALVFEFLLLPESLRFRRDSMCHRYTFFPDRNDTPEMCSAQLVGSPIAHSRSYEFDPVIMDEKCKLNV